MTITPTASPDRTNTLDKQNAVWPFGEYEPGYIVMIAGSQGLHEVLETAPSGQLILRALNADGLPLVHMDKESVCDFGPPIYHCFAARDRSEIVALVNGEDYDVTVDDSVLTPAPLFQAIHGRKLIEFAQLAAGAGFSAIDLTNGYDAWEGTITDLIAECHRLEAEFPDNQPT